MQPNSIITIVVIERRAIVALLRGSLLFWIVFVLAGVLPAAAQSPLPKGPDWDGRLIWVFPFQNNSSQPGLDWIGASFPDIVNQRLSSAGFLTIRREDRRYALEHLGLPADFHPTQATTYRIAQTLDADYVVFGSYTVANGRISTTARVLFMNGPKMGPTLEEDGNLDQLIAIEDTLAWKIAMQVDPSSNLDKQTFLAASRDLRLDAFENYIRGEIEPGLDEQIGHLTKAVQLSPNYVQAWFALGNAYFANQQYEESEVPFSKVPKGSRLWLEATFYAGLSHLYTGNYAKAQEEFAAISAVLPMPEVLNNEGIAINRRGQNGTALFDRVVQLNPQNPDYWFNLAVSERRGKNYNAALKAVDRSLALRPQDEEALRLKKNVTQLKDGTLPAPEVTSTGKNVVASSEPAADSSPAAATSAEPQSDGKNSATAPKAAADSKVADSQEYEPLERIVRTYDESSFRQAAFEMEQMDALKFRSMPPAERARQLSQQGTEYINDGLLLEAERQFQLAVAADPSSAAAYAGLAEVHEHVGSTKVAEQEANQSIQRKPNVPAYLVLARLALAQRAYPEAEKNVEQALRIDPQNGAAKGILQAIQAQQAGKL
ncbi:MAG TPA: tetratricopeptide repeat protein [Acidobacteriaceae bacterium]|nr:tetratricopeptide repeat protein [Acidobacteriaceae bacterium]